MVELAAELFTERASSLPTDFFESALEAMREGSSKDPRLPCVPGSAVVFPLLAGVGLLIEEFKLLLDAIGDCNSVPKALGNNDGFKFDLGPFSRC